MIRHRRRERVLAACLSALAGYVDALGFIYLGGFFVSFMSGNSTRLGVGIGQRLDDAVVPLAIVGLFVLGVVAGSLVGRLLPRRREATVLLEVGVFLCLAAGFDRLGLGWGAIGFTALAMGCENAVFERDGEVSIGLTYMTGTLVKLGQRLTGALLGGPRWAWMWYLLLWLGLVAGAAVGAATYPVLGLQGLWFAAAVATGCALIAQLTLGQRPPG